MSVVFDSSALLAVVFDERGAGAIVPRRVGACTSTVTLSECLSKMLDRGFNQDTAREILLDFGLDVVAFNDAQVWKAGVMRARYRRSGLSFADCACLALAAETGLPALTGDRLWAELDHGIPVEVFR
jgi:PIN domain nuclease of toxin-antitoxin system